MSTADDPKAAAVAVAARRSALARSRADAKLVVAESMRPGNRAVISWRSQPLPSGS
jgi:hypothetical protein